MDPVEEFAGRHRNSLQECIVGLVVARGEKFFEQFVVEFPQNLSADKVKDSFIEIGMEFMALLRSHDGGNLSPDVVNLTRPIREVYKDYFVIEDHGKYLVETENGDGPGPYVEHSWDDLSKATRYPYIQGNIASPPQGVIHQSQYEMPPTARRVRIRVKETIEVSRQ